MDIEVASLVARLILDDSKFTAKVQQGKVSTADLFKELGKGVGITLGVGAAFAATTGFVVSATKETFEYADAVREQMQVSGEDAEASSRLIQVLDDHKLSTENLKKATKSLAKEGYAPTIETIAELSDQYLALNTQQERNNFLIKNFGKDGLKWAETMMLGKDALLAEGDAVAKNLILTDRFVLEARLAEMQMDKWNDSIQGVKTQLAVGLIGALDGSTVAITRQAQEIFKAANGYEFNTNMSKRYTQAQRDAWDAAVKQAEADWMQAHALDGATGAMKDAELSAQELEEQAKELTKAIKEQIDTVQDIAKQDENYAKDLDNLNDKKAELAKQYAELDPLSKTYAQDLVDLDQKTQELAQEEARLTSQYEQDTHRRIAALLQEKLAVGGLTETEYRMWEQYMIHNGMITQEQANRARAERQVADEIANGITRVEDADARYNQILNELNGKQVNVDINVRTNYTQSGNPPPASVLTGGYYSTPTHPIGYQRAAGGPVGAGQNYMVSEFNRPERFIPAQNGRIVGMDEGKKETSLPSVTILSDESIRKLIIEMRKIARS